MRGRVTVNINDLVSINYDYSLALVDMFYSCALEAAYAFM